MATQFRRTAHSVYLCDYHIIFPTKYRRNVINDGLFSYLKRKLIEVTEHHPVLYIKETNHDQDHIHLLISIPPQMSVGSVVRLLKTNTSRNIKQQFPFLKQVYWGTDGIWSESYFVSTVGINEAIIRKYIENQGAEDMGQTATLFDDLKPRA
jgi:putative transposase